MQPIEIALFGAVVALAAGLIGYLLWPFARARRAATNKRRTGAARAGPMVAAADAPAPSLVCPACQREYDAGLQFCPHDARELVPAGDAAARGAAPGVTCPNCRRSFDAMKRFCPFDGDELVPLTLALGSAAGGPRSAPPAWAVSAPSEACPAPRTWPASPARPPPLIRRNDGQDLPALLAALRERRDVLRSRRRLARVGELTQQGPGAWAAVLVESRQCAV